MRFLIPSYDRADTISTVDWLISYGVSPKMITVGLQKDDSDLAKYESRLAASGVNWTVSKAHNPAGNRNALLRDADGEIVCLMDDDIRGLSSRNMLIEKIDDTAPHRGKGVRQRTLTSGGVMRLLMQWKHVLDAGAAAVTINVTDNSGYLARMDYADRFITHVPCISQVMFMRACEENLFDDSLDMNEDSEWGARIYSEGRLLVRDTSISCKTSNRQMNLGDPTLISGGITHLLDRRERDVQLICDRWPDILRPPAKGSTNVRFLPRRRVFTEYKNEFTPDMFCREMFMTKNGDYDE